jgi:antitoxin ParD1/3/4
LRALREHEAAVDRWLERDVVPIYDAMRDDPARAVPLEAAMDTLRTRHAARVEEEQDDPGTGRA